jgi:hypothetical protein
MHFVRPLPSKSSVAIQNALRSIAAAFPPTVQLHRVRLDNAKELDALVGKWITEAGGKHEPTPPYTSEYNGVIKRFNREIMTCVQCLLFDARLPSEWWAEAARHACDVINVTPTWSNPGNMSPFTLWHGTPPPSQHLWVFSAPGTMWLHVHERHKTLAQSIPVCFMGVIDYLMSMYQVYIPSQRRAVDTCNVIFDEHSALRPPADNSSPVFVYVPLSDEDDEGLSQQHPAAPHATHNGHTQPEVPGTGVDNPRESSTAADAAAPAPDNEDTPTPAPPGEIVTPAPTNAPTKIIGAAHGQSVPSKQVD